MFPAAPALLVSAALTLGTAVVAPEVAVPPAHAHRPVHHAVAPRTSTPAAVLARLTLPQRVGQLFLVGTPADRADRRTRAQIARLHVGSVMLTGRSYDGVEAPARVARTMRAQVSPAATGGVGLLVATDQEGGLVRVLQGPGFSDIPTALVQGTWGLPRLRSAAHTWAEELRRAGVDLDLAPVLDTVPGPRAARHNPPIGYYHREFGYTTTRVAHHGRAFVRGLRDGGVLASVKHFPGLGRVRANTDTNAGVTDRVTRRHDPYFRPFAAAVDDGVAAVMMSTAYYARLDPRLPAAFSPFVIGTVLRGDLGFDGVVVSDDLGRARQVASFTPAGRALRFVGAGGDLLLSVDPAPVPQMYAAVLDRARHSERFRAKVDAAALRVLRMKARAGVLSPGAE